MTEFISAADAIESRTPADERRIRDEVANIIFRLRRAMDAGLSPDEMKAAKGEKAAAEAAEELLSLLFK